MGKIYGCGFAAAQIGSYENGCVYEMGVPRTQIARYSGGRVEGMGFSNRPSDWKLPRREDL